MTFFLKALPVLFECVIDIAYIWSATGCSLPLDFQGYSLQTIAKQWDHVFGSIHLFVRMGLAGLKFSVQNIVLMKNL